MSRARRVTVTERLDHRADYADAFEIRVSGPDERTAEQWVRAGLEQAPAAVRWLIVAVHRHVLRLHLGPFGDGDHVLGWRIITDDPGVVRLDASGPLAAAMIMGRRLDPTRMQLTTSLSYRRPALARAVWAFVGPLHRTIAPLLLRRAARRPATVR